MTDTPHQQRPRRGHPFLWWIVVAGMLAAIALAVTGMVMERRAGPILKGRVINTLSARFNSRVELDTLDVSILKGLEVSGTGLRIYAPDNVVAAGAKDPVITMGSFYFHTGLRDLFVKPTHIGKVHVSNVQIRIPPREQRAAETQQERKKRGKIQIVVDDILVENSDLIIVNSNPGKDPKHFVLQRIALHDFGPDKPLTYDATLINAIPRGDIHATGHFGPWNVESPGDSAVDGSYNFDHADLNTIRGIGGTLTSVGRFAGRLNRIEAQGTTKTPDFSLDTANHPMPLETSFSATIDGTTGDTYLNQVQATLGHSRFACSGAVVNVRGRGHVTDLDINIPAGHLRDFLELAVKTNPPVMQSTVGMKVHIRVPYGTESVTHKLQMHGSFSLRNIHFTNPQVQDKVDDLSLRAQGDPQDAKPGAEDVFSSMTGQLAMDNGRINISKLHYVMPGAEANLDGVYSLNGEVFDFHGTVRTQAKVSQMIASKWKSFLLKAVDPFFHKNGAGAEIPVKITGTQGAPKFGLDFGHKDEQKQRR